MNLLEDTLRSWFMFQNWCKGVHKSTILCSVGGEGGMQKDSSSSKVIWWMVRCALPLEDVQSYD